jgi:hypothetical protein
MSFNDLAFYFSPSAASTVVDRINGNNGTIYETINGNLYADSTLSTIVGRVAISQVIFDTNDTNMSGVFETTGQTTFFLANGNILYTFAVQTIKIGNNYVFPQGQFTFNLTNATGMYQSMYGQVTISSIDTPVELRIFSLALKWKHSNNYLYN